VAVAGGSQKVVGADTRTPGSQHQQQQQQQPPKPAAAAAAGTTISCWGRLAPVSDSSVGDWQLLSMACYDLHACSSRFAAARDRAQTTGQHVEAHIAMMVKDMLVTVVTTA
jgi:hypothetical protein